MKQILLMILLAFIVAGADINAQKPIIIGDDSLSFGKAKLPCLVVKIPEVSYEKVRKSWIRTLQAGTKSKATDENGEISVFGAIKKDITPQPLNIYSKLINNDSIVCLMAAFELKKDEYIEKAKDNNLFTNARNFLKNFAKDQYIDLAREQLSDENKKLRDLNGDLKSSRNSESKFEKSIQDNRKTILLEKDNIVIQNNEVTKLSAEIIEMNSQLSGMTDGVAKDEKAKYIKDLEKKKKKLLNNVESSENKITKANSEIDDAERSIPKANSEQEAIMGKISGQEKIVRKYEDKLKTIEGY